ncbi:MAG TPA: class I SAM-dependent methyltransferase [Bdellovibrionota bacterium]|nr:class I SAM-dependent methyltransferase [Bdellovibrionota bacterium]
MLGVFCSRSFLARYRKAVLAEANGEVLEIGFGTGLNLPHYPAEKVAKITAIDTNVGMRNLAHDRMMSSSIPVEHVLVGGDALPMPDNSYDTVVSTWVLCSIKENVQGALKELYRVLKPNGKFIFLEHGLSPDPKVRAWQDRLNPIQVIIADGCHLNRDVKGLISQAGFQFEKLREYYLEKTPKVGGYMYEGVATKK